MNYDFDKVIDRTNTNSLKYDFAVERGRPADVLPLWVADMDFPAPQPVLDALQKAVAHGIFGYSEVKRPTTRPWPAGLSGTSAGGRRRAGSSKRPAWCAPWPWPCALTPSPATPC